VWRVRTAAQQGFESHALSQHYRCRKASSYQQRSRICCIGPALRSTILPPYFGLLSIQFERCDEAGPRPRMECLLSWACQRGNQDSIDVHAYADQRPSPNKAGHFEHVRSIGTCGR
jgi:hypothetical protein